MELHDLQTLLKKRGLYDGLVDNLSGPKTRTAITAFLKIEAPRTYNRLDNAEREVAAYQVMLRLAGMDVGEIDGKIGPQTRQAMDAYEKTDTKRTEVIKENAPGILKPTPEVKNIWPTQKQVPVYYGAMGKNQAHVSPPWEMFLAWNTEQKVRTISVHEKCAESAQRCLDRIGGAYTMQQIQTLGLHLFGGSMNVRKMRGGNAWSMHSWGIAIDFDPIRNQYRWGRDKARLAQPDAELFWRIWEEEGWVSLGRQANYDWMHVQAARI